MARTFTVKGRIEAEDAASGVVARVQSSIAGLGDTLASHFVISAGDAERAMRLLVTAFTDSVGAAAESQEVVGRLAAALNNAGPGALRFTDALLAQSKQLEATTRFSDEAVVSAQALLATFGVAPERIGKATQAAVDLAAALGVDLDTAARQLGGTFNGVTRGLDRLAPELKDLSDTALKSGAAIDVLAEKLQGRAAAAADNFTGRLQQLRNALNDVQEAAGNTIVESQPVSDSMEAAAIAARAWASALGVVIPALAKIAPAFLPGLATVREFPGLVLLVERQLQALADGGAADAEKFSTEWAGAFRAFQQAAQVGTDAAQGFQDFLDRLSGHTAALERLARINVDVGNGIATLSGIANEFGFDLESNVNAQLENNRLKTLAVEAAVRLGSGTYRDQTVALAFLAVQHAQLIEKLDHSAASTLALARAQLALKAATDGTTQSIVNQQEIISRGLSTFGLQQQFSGSGGGNFTIGDGVGNGVGIPLPII